MEGGHAMRVSLWRQFSSNHSARFTIVGVFESVEAAQRAADKFRRMLARMTEWLADPANADADSLWHQQGFPPPTPPEQALAEQYGVDWGPYSIDWFWGDDFSWPIEEPRVDMVTTFERTVFISPFRQSDFGAKPADTLLERLGATVVVDGDLLHMEGEHSYLTVELTCTAPDQQTAQALVAQYRQHLENMARRWERWGEQGAYEEPEPPWPAAEEPWAKWATLTNGRVTRRGRQLHFHNLQLGNLPYALPALIAHLRQQGCTNISYAFKEERDDERGPVVLPG
jgi:hypothetical protein